MTQPTTAIGGELNALATANVAVANAVFGNMNENQFMAKPHCP